MKYLISILMMTMTVVAQSQTEGSKTDQFSVLIMDSLEYIPWVVKDFKGITLTDEEIHVVDSLFIDFKDKSNNGDSMIQAMGEIGAMDYRRQYLPVVNAKNEKLIWINCFCVLGTYLPHFSSTSPGKWKREVIIIKDGGNCFFSVFLNLNDGRFYQLMVNGI